MTATATDQLAADLALVRAWLACPDGYTQHHAAGAAMRLCEAVERLQAAIRQHRDYRGDDRCFLDDGELYAVLPEGDTRPKRETAVTLLNCAKYIACRQTGREYVSPQRRIEELEAEVARLRRLNEGLCQQIADAADVIAANAVRNALFQG